MADIIIKPGNTLKFVNKEGKLIYMANSDYALDVLREDLSGE